VYIIFPLTCKCGQQDGPSAELIRPGSQEETHYGRHGALEHRAYHRDGGGILLNLPLDLLQSGNSVWYGILWCW